MAGTRMRHMVLGGVALAAAAPLAIWLLAPTRTQPPVLTAPPAQPVAVAREVKQAAQMAEAADEATAVAVDLFRVDATGSGIVAGQAAPGAKVEVRLDGSSVATGTADAAGSFVSLFSVPLDATPRVLSLTTPERGNAPPRSADQTFIIQPRGAPDAASGVARDSGSETPGAPAPTAPAAGGPVGEGGLDAASADAPDIAAVPTILRQDASGLAVVQSADRVPEALDRLSIDTITYGDNGTVSLGGRAAAAGAVRVYVDDRPVEAVTATLDGQWRAALPPLDSRVYTLRVDTLGADGRVLARAETPFRPETPSALARLSRDAEGNEVALVTVQPGFTLWRIADENYGDGFKFVRVFEANADKIRDPDLIYPGQIFTVPE